MSISPADWSFQRFKQVIKKPIPNKGIATEAILKEKPKSDTIQAVTVVPIFAPKIIPIACVRDII